MSIWSAVPDWITAGATVGSLVLLFDYARSARRQVEGISRPIVVVQQRESDVRIANIGNGVALNVTWVIPGRNPVVRHLEAMSVNGFEDVFRVAANLSLYEVFDEKPFAVLYESVSGRKYRTKASTKSGDEYRPGFELTIEEI